VCFAWFGKPKSQGSAVNIGRVGKLTNENKMQPAGQQAFQAGEDAPGKYFYEWRHTAEPDGEQRRFRGGEAARYFFPGQAPWYRQTATWWVLSAQKPERRDAATRLDPLIEDSAASRTLPPLTRKTRE
jgi:hypothetical protein